MTTAEQQGQQSQRLMWAGRIIGAIPLLLLLMSAAMKLLQLEAVSDGLPKLGWPASYAVGLGVLELLCVVIYAIPRTCLLGAILVTGYLGGAIATHVRIGEMNVVMHVLLGAFAWLGLFLRDKRFRELLLHGTAK
jgi:hypothetical protein